MEVFSFFFSNVFIFIFPFLTLQGETPVRESHKYDRCPAKCLKAGQLSFIQNVVESSISVVALSLGQSRQCGLWTHHQLQLLCH